MSEDDIDPGDSDGPGDEGEPIDVHVAGESGSGGGVGLESEFDDLDFDLPETVDREAVERMRTIARVMDEFVEVPGTNVSVGLDPILGVIPVVGDVASAAFSLYIVLESARLGVGFPTLLKMIGNVVIDAAGGSVPYVGTLFDAVWKANQWNLELALESLAESAPDEGSGREPVTIEVESPDDE